MVSNALLMGCYVTKGGLAQYKMYIYNQQSSTLILAHLILKFITQVSRAYNPEDINKFVRYLRLSVRTTKNYIKIQNGYY